MTIVISAFNFAFKLSTRAALLWPGGITRRLHRALAYVLLSVLMSVPTRLLALEPARNEACQRPLRSLELGEGVGAVCYRDWLLSIFIRANCRLESVSMGDVNPARRVLLIESGAADLVPSIGYQKDYERFGRFSQAYGRNQILLFVRAGEAARWPIKSLCDPVMSRARVIGPQFGWFGDEFEAVRSKNKACALSMSYYNESVLQGIGFMQRKRADVLISTSGAWRRNQQEYAKIIEPLPIVIDSRPLFILYNRARVSAEQVALIDAAISQDRRQYGPPCQLEQP